MKTGTPNHLKTRRLKRLLNQPQCTVVGVLELIWHLAAECADDGAVGKWSNQEIADFIDWNGDADLLINSLVEAGWLDRDADESKRLVIHDWLDHAPEYIKERLRKRRAREAKSNRNSADFSGNCPAPSGQDSDNSEPKRNGAGHAAACPVYTQPSPTNPSQAKPNPTTPPTNPPADQVGGEAGFSWKDVGDRLARLGAVQWKTAVEQAQGAACTPMLAMQLIDYGNAHTYGVGAILQRLERANPNLPLETGWPKPDSVKSPKATAEREEKKRQQDADDRATTIIRAMRKEKKSDEEIEAMLRSNGLKWPSG